MTNEKKTRGWLVNEARKERRDRANTFTDQNAIDLIKKIDTLPEYISPKLPEELDAKTLDIRPKNQQTLHTKNKHSQIQRPKQIS